jgi:hypothetical protein
MVSCKEISWGSGCFGPRSILFLLSSFSVSKDKSTGSDHLLTYKRYYNPVTHEIRNVGSSISFAALSTSASTALLTNYTLFGIVGKVNHRAQTIIWPSRFVLNIIRSNSTCIIDMVAMNPTPQSSFTSEKQSNTSCKMMHHGSMF